MNGAHPVPEPIRIVDAGVVLCAPFLPELFGRCALSEQGQFLDAARQAQAVHLLEFLLGNESPRESKRDPTLTRLLCGVDLAAILPPVAPLSESQRQAAESVLASIIAQWPRGTQISVAGLRSSYLVRPGRLQLLESHWTLSVERRAWDVLLAELPWSFQRVALHPKPLVVD